MDEVVSRAWDTEKVTLALRMRLFFWLVVSFALPVAAVLLWGAHLVGSTSGGVTLGAVTTVALYVVQLRTPLFELLMWVDEIQVASASLARIIGIELVEPDRTPGPHRPDRGDVEASGVRYAYREGEDVLHGIDLTLTPGERLAIVGPSGAGKSTFGRMLAGIHPPTGGRVTVAGVPLVDLPEDDLRRHVALVTQEHHVFVGSVADNLRLAKQDATEAELTQALAAVDAAGWVAALPAGAEVRVETENGNIALTLPAGTSADMEAETQTGSISVEGLSFTNRYLDQDGVRQHFRGRLGSGRADVRATTEVGAIRLAEGQRLELDGIELFRPEDDSTVVPPGAPVAPNPPVR